MRISRRLCLPLVSAMLLAAGAATGPPALAAPPSPAPLVTDPASLVNPFIGTTAGGNVFPGPDLPFGMVQWSPDTSPDRNDGGGYEFTDSMLRGFSLTHISGPGCGAYGDVPILPLVGGMPAGDPGSHMEPFSHTGESATAGYYTVRTGTTPVQTELTAGLRSAMARFTFPATAQAGLLFKLLDSQNGTMASSATVIGSNELAGSAMSGHFCGSSAVYTVHFDVLFDHPFTASQVVTEAGQPGPNSVFLTFDASRDQVLQAKVGISFVSAANAAQNVRSDQPGFHFDRMRANASRAWNRVLGRIQVGGGTHDQQAAFYTNVYHTLLHPNVFSDANGQYMGFDDQVHSVRPGHIQYANFSGWDIYHSTVQLQAVVDPRTTSDIAQSMVDDALQFHGQLQQWGFANAETYVMVGDPADGILGGAWAFGARGFDARTALQLAVAQATKGNNIRPGLNYLDSLGYFPSDGKGYCCNFRGVAAETVEYGQADFALSRFAAALGDHNDAQMLLARSQGWQHILNPATGLLTPKMLSGQFVPGVTPGSGAGYVEGSAEQYRWVVPYNQHGLYLGMGGNQKVVPQLDAFFQQLNSGATHALLGNEFDQMVPWTYDFAGDPAGTQNVVNRMRIELYPNNPGGIPGNDDLGAMGALDAWGAIGLYPVYMATADMVLNSPQFPRTVIHLGNGRTVDIRAPQASPTTPYVQSMRLDGRTWNKPWIPASVMRNGGRLDFTLGATPTGWGSAAKDAPPSYSFGQLPAIGFTNPGDQVVVQPGGSADAAVGAQNISTRSQTIIWQATAPSGVTVSPSSGSFKAAAGQAGSQPVHVQAGSGEGRFTITFQLTTASGVKLDTSALSIAVAKPGELFPYFDNAGVSDDANRSAANFDSDGFSYSANALAAAGLTPGKTVTVDGLTYTWPNSPSGQPDNITAGGQTIPLAPTAGATKIGLLGSAANANPGSQGTLVVHFSDGTSQQVTVGLSDWTLGAGSFPVAFGNAIVATTPYRNTVGGGTDNVKTYVYAADAALTPGKTVVSVTLPASVDQGDFHVFSIALG